MILFVDDEKRYTKNYIEEIKEIGFKVSYMNNVGEALAFIKSKESKDIEAIVLDVMMPSGVDFTDEETEEDLNTGIEFYKKVREVYPNVKVFVLTNVSREKVRKFFENQKDCYFDRKDDLDLMPTGFAAKVREVLQKQNQ